MIDEGGLENAWVLSLETMEGKDPKLATVIQVCHGEGWIPHVSHRNFES